MVRMLLIGLEALATYPAFYPIFETHNDLSDLDQRLLLIKRTLIIVDTNMINCIMININLDRVNFIVDFIDSDKV